MPLPHFLSPSYLELCVLVTLNRLFPALPHTTNRAAACFLAFAHSVSSARELSFPLPSLMFAFTAHVQTQFSTHYIDLYDGEPGVPSLAVSML